MTMNVNIVNIFILFGINSCIGNIEIGRYLKTCDRNAIDVNDCLVEAVRDGLARMTDGISDLGVPPLDPYHQQLIKVEYKQNQIFVKMTMMDVVVEGLKRAKIVDARLKADEDNFHLEMDMKTPKVFVSGQYHGEGRYNSLIINAHGQFNTTMRDLVYTWKLDGVPFTKNDTNFIKITSFYMRPDVSDMISHLTDDSPDNKAIVEFANTFANANWRLLYRELLPYAQANWNKIGIRVANKVFLKVPYDQLFPSNI